MLQELAGDLKELITLKKISLDFFGSKSFLNSSDFFRSYDISDAGASAISNALKNMSSLEKIYLDFCEYKRNFKYTFQHSSRTKIGEIGMKSLGSALNTLNSLEDLEIELDWSLFF